jgi:predicted Abi (CAAX) family protease
VIAARYRTGDGSGLTTAGFGNTVAQDAVRALCSALSTSEPLLSVATDLRNALQPSARMPQRGDARFDMASTFDDAPLERVRGSLGGWRLWRPRAAARAVERILSRRGWHRVTTAARAGTNERAAEPAKSEV